MRLSRPSRCLAILITLFCFLFTQLAVAAYTCPEQDAAGVPMAQSMPDCPNMDLAQPVLCAAHCDAHQQSLDKPDAPQVPPFVAAELTVVLLDGAAQYAVCASAPPVPLLRTAAPPLAIRNCCFRL